MNNSEEKVGSIRKNAGKMLISLQILFLTSDIRFLKNAIVVGETTYNCMYLSRTI